MKHSGTWRLAVFMTALALGAPVLAEEATKPAKTGEAAEAKSGAEEAGNRLVHNGVIVDFDITPVGSGAKKELMADQLAEVRFKITNERTGEPVRGASPGAWMDMGQVLQGKPGSQQKSCKDKVMLYLQGAVGIRPLIDLNSYFVVVMNSEPSITIVDPVVSMAGRTSTLGKLVLPGPGADWATTADQKRVYVSVPGAGKVVVVDSEGFKVGKQIDAGKEPMRVALQPDGKYLWVGNDGKGAGESGLTVIDTEKDEVVTRIATGKGHHEVAFTDDNRTAFVSNRDEGTVSVIDIATRTRNKDLKTGPLPISIAFSSQSKSLYVADGKDGVVTVYDGRTLEQVKKITLKSGLGPMRFSPDGRYGLVVNPKQDTVYVIDAASNELVNTIKVTGEPFQIAFSSTFAYVRSLYSERVTQITLRTLGKGSKPSVQSFAAGSQAPRSAGQLTLADSITAATNDAAVFVVNPADNTTYYYVEGMNAPSSNYQIMGSSARAVTLVDRSLKEIEPGVYAGKVRLPASGHYDVAFLMQSPQVLHCFSADAKDNPLTPKSGPLIAVQYDDKQRVVKAGEPLKFRFKLIDTATGQPRLGLQDARVLYYLAPGRNRTEVPARDLGDGTYEAEINVAAAGAYYVYVGVPSMKLGFNVLPYFSLRAVSEGDAKPPDKKS
jgi:YVTN family beta-propeller protein